MAEPIKVRVYTEFFKITRRKYAWFLLVTLENDASYTLNGVANHPPTQEELLDILVKRENLPPLTRDF